MSFSFKQFHIDDTNCAMKVGTDAVILGAWSNITNSRHILDVGAGSGVISLIIASRMPNDFNIIAVEKDEGAVHDCLQNFLQSQWSIKLKVINSDFADLDGQYDMIISNPPFFCGSLSSNTKKRTMARQGDTLNYFSLLDYAATHLTEDGNLTFISDVRYEKEILFSATVKGFILVRQCQVYPKKDRPASRIIWEFHRVKHERKDIEIQREVIYIKNADGSWHDDYIKLTKNLYMKEL